MTETSRPIPIFAITMNQPDPNNPEFTADELAQIEAFKTRYPETKAALMPTMWMAQHKWGWLSEPVLALIANTLDIPKAHVRGVASFYTMYFKKPMGKYHIQVCTNVSCMLRKGEEIYRHISNRLGIGTNEATSDHTFSLEEVECMGACGGAPMIAINETFHENVDIASVDMLIEKINGQG